jgi:hypothetical protein
MFELKEKIINSSLVKGKKRKSEKSFQTNLKNFNRLNKKSVASIIKLTVSHSYFVFNANTKTKNASYFYLPKNRLSAAIKESHKHNLFKNIGDTMPQIVKQKQEEVLLNRKFLYFYRWNTKK